MQCPNSNEMADVSWLTNRSRRVFVNSCDREIRMLVVLDSAEDLLFAQNFMDVAENGFFFCLVQ